MPITKTDGAMFVYTLAAIFTGIVAMDRIGVEGKVPTLAAAVVLAVLWTVYFKYSMKKRFIDDEGGDDDSVEGSRA